MTHCSSTRCRYSTNSGRHLVPTSAYSHEWQRVLLTQISQSAVFSMAVSFSLTCVASLLFLSPTHVVSQPEQELLYIVNRTQTCCFPTVSLGFRKSLIPFLISQVVGMLLQNRIACSCHGSRACIMCTNRSYQW